MYIVLYMILKIYSTIKEVSLILIALNIVFETAQKYYILLSSNEVTVT